MGDEKDQLACNIQKRANAVGISITKLCHDAGVSRRWFEDFKRRVPKAVVAYVQMDRKLKQLERENAALKQVVFTCPRTFQQRHGVIKQHNGVSYIYCAETNDSYAINSVLDLHYYTPELSNL